MSTVLTLILRQLRWVEWQLAGMDSPLATEAQQQVHKALLNCQTLERLEEHNSLRHHVLGDRP